MRQAVLLAFTSLLLVTSGCKSQCRILSEKLCDCAVNSNDKTTCLQRVSQQESTFPPSAEQEAVCKSLEEGCDCRLIDTPSGKRALRAGGVERRRHLS